jgi:small conductance mechanosensitive channel
MLEPLLNKLLSESTTLIVQFLPKFFLGIGIFVIFLLLSVIAAWLIGRMSKLITKRRVVVDLLKTVARVTILVIGTITALGTMGMNVTALVASLGLTSLGIGLALKDAVSSVISGVLIIIYRPFKVNDHVSIGSIEGVVKNISFRYITIYDGEDKILVPNSQVFTQAIRVHA